MCVTEKKYIYVCVCVCVRQSSADCRPETTTGVSVSRVRCAVERMGSMLVQTLPVEVRTGSLNEG